MGGQDEKTARTLEMLNSSEERLNRCVDELLKDPAVKAALQRDQNPEHHEDGGRSKKVA